MAAHNLGRYKIHTFFFPCLFWRNVLFFRRKGIWRTTTPSQFTIQLLTDDAHPVLCRNPVIFVVVSLAKNFVDSEMATTG